MNRPGSATATTPPALPARAARISRSGTAFGLAGVLTFSLTLPFTRLAVSGLDPWFAGSGRAVVAALLAAVLLAVRRVRRPGPGQVGRLLVVAAGVVVGFPLLTSAALRSVPAGHGAVVVGVLPLATAVVASVRGRERPPLRFWLAGAAGLVAVLVFLASGAGGFGRPGAADLLLLGAVALAALGYAEGGLLAREIGAWQTICWALLLALPVVAPLAVVGALRAGPSSLADAGAGAWLALGYLSVFSMFLGFFAWYRGLAIGPLTSVSQLQLLQSVFTLAWSALFFGEDVGARVWIAATAVLLCALTATRARIRAVG